jgi:hypothetical protein
MWYIYLFMCVFISILSSVFAVIFSLVMKFESSVLFIDMVVIPIEPEPNFINKDVYGPYGEYESKKLKEYPVIVGFINQMKTTNVDLLNKINIENKNAFIDNVIGSKDLNFVIDNDKKLFSDLIISIKEVLINEINCSTEAIIQEVNQGASAKDIINTVNKRNAEISSVINKSFAEIISLINSVKFEGVSVNFADVINHLTKVKCDLFNAICSDTNFIVNTIKSSEVIYAHAHDITNCINNINMINEVNNSTFLFLDLIKLGYVDVINALYSVKVEPTNKINLISTFNTSTLPSTSIKISDVRSPVLNIGRGFFFFKSHIFTNAMMKENGSFSFKEDFI